MRVKNCCCCISIEFGVMILGCLVCFDLLQEFEWFNPVRLAITLAAGGCFLNMVFNDSAKHREYFFYSYIAHCIS